jgi:hypothetical protein
MIAAEIIDQVLHAGGQITVDGDDLVLTAPRPLPADLLDRLAAYKPDILAALPKPDRLPPLSPEAEARRQKVPAMLARDGGQYAVTVDDADTDPIILSLATPDSTCDVLIPKDTYAPFDVLAMVNEWEREDPKPEPLLWRVTLTEPGGKVFEVDAPSGCTLANWQAYA